MKSGIYALAALDGAPLEPGDRAIVFAGREAPPLNAAGCLLAAQDADAGAISAQREGDRIELLLGSLDEPEEAARALGLDPRVPPTALAAAAHDRWGVATAVRLSGEWLLARWDGSARTLTLLMSECARDDCYFAVAGGRVAVAPTLAGLARLPWVDDDFDAEMLVRTMGRYQLRTGMGERTILKGVSQLRSGSAVTIRVDGTVTEMASPPPPPALAKISFEDAMGEVEALLRRIMRQRMARADDVAFMLSGGLDSSLLAWLGAEECRPGQRLHFLCSASPEGSGIADETGWAQAVTDHLGAPLIRIVPVKADIYVPAPAMFEARAVPTLSPRHYLYRALEDAAASRGASLLVDGAFGELTVSNHGFFQEPPVRRLRRLARLARDGIGALARGRQARLVDDFHVQLAPALLASMAPTDAAPEESLRRLGAHDAIGYEMGWRKTAGQVTAASDPRTRFALPFRDRRLLRLVAALPASFATKDGAPRAMARALLRGHVPDRIALRQCKMAFSPTYQIMLRAHAPAARARIAAQHDADAGDWLDLDWLDRSLAAVAAGATLTLRQSFRVQGTAIAAEFFRWWRPMR